MRAARYARDDRRLRRAGLLIALVVLMSCSRPAATPAPETIRVPDAHVSAFPDGTNTGVPAGTVLTPHPGDLTIVKPGTVVDSLDVTGSISVQADDVAIKRTRVRTGAPYGIRIFPGYTRTRIHDVEVDGLGRASKLVFGGLATLQRVNLHNGEDGYEPGSGSEIVDSFIHDLHAAGEAHYDGVVLDSGADITIRRNTIHSNSDQTSAVMIDNYGGPVSNVVVDGNLLTGGGYTVYVDAHFNAHPITGVVLTNNRLGKGYWGYFNIRNATPTLANNVDATTGVPIAG
jgi:hypothetical protein